MARKNKIESVIGIVLYIILVLGFFAVVIVIVIDIQVNGDQIVNIENAPEK